MAKKTKVDALKTRQHLIETAIVQFALRGVANTTLNDIADAADVTRGAIYWHFENKTQLFNEIWLQQPPLRELIQDRLTEVAEIILTGFTGEMYCCLTIYCSSSSPAGINADFIS